MIVVHGAGRSHRCTVGGVGAVAPQASEGGKAVHPALIDGIRFRVRTGVPWRDVPAEYGPWGRVYDLFRRWQRDGTWPRILTRLQSLADAGAIVWDLRVDSKVCRAHQHAAGARKRGPCRRNHRAVSLTSPVIMGLDAHAVGSPPSCTWLSSGARNQRGDSPQFEPVLEKARVPRVAPVGEQATWPCARVSAQAPDRWDRVQER